MKVLCCPLASHGFVFPIIGIAQTLRARGHELAFVTGLQFGPVLEAAGLERIPRGDKDGHSFQITLWGDPISIAIQVKHIEYALARFQPDLLLASELALGALIAGELHGLPVVLLGMSAFPWSTQVDGRPDREDPDATRRHRYLFEGRRKLHNEARAHFGLPKRNENSIESPLLGDRFLLRSVEALERGRGSLPPPVRFVGDCLWSPPDVEPDPAWGRWLHAALAAGEPIIYVQHGRTFTVPSFWPALVEALRRERIWVAAALGRMQGQVEVGAVPAHFLARAHLDQNRVLPHAQAVVSSGTTTAVLGALTLAKPMLLIPAGGEQHDVALRCRCAGVARALSPYELTPALVAGQLREVLERLDLRANARRLQTAFAAFDGARRAAEELETLVDARTSMLAS